MKGYKFKLDAVLKIRKLKEEQCKMEIGRIQVRINLLKSEISKHNVGIEHAYESQEESLKDGLTGQELQFHPYFVSGKRAHIGYLENEIRDLTHDVNQKFDELKQLRANVKVIDEMKEKDKLKYKKAYQKKQDEVIEEQVQNWRMSMKL